ncbi:hypothetical protein Pfo_003443, partial [Paulownia fortunei]
QDSTAVTQINKKEINIENPKKQEKRKEIQNEAQIYNFLNRQRESNHAMAAESPVACENPQAIRVAPPRYGPGNLIARFTSSDRESRKSITAPAKFQVQMMIIIIIIIITYRVQTAKKES